MKKNASQPINAAYTTHSTEPRLQLVSVEQIPSAVSEPSPIRSPEEAHEALRAYFERKDREHFVVLHLDGSHQAISAEVVSIGTLQMAVVHPREVFKAAILANAAAIICAHNHPSGVLDPSTEDRRVYDRLFSAGELLGIKVLDFLIVSHRGTWAASKHWA